MFGFYDTSEKIDLQFTNVENELRTFEDEAHNHNTKPHPIPEFIIFTEDTNLPAPTILDNQKEKPSLGRARLLLKKEFIHISPEERYAEIVAQKINQKSS